MIPKQYTLTLAALATAFISAHAGIINIPDALGQTGVYSVNSDIDDITGEESVYLTSTMEISNPSGEYLFGNLFLETSTSAPGGAGQQRIGVGNVVNTDNWGVNGAGNIASGTSVALDTPTTMVLKMNQLTGEWTFWLNPDLSQPEPASGDLSGTNAGITDGIGFIRLRGGRYGAIPENTNVTDYTNLALYFGGDSPFNVPTPKFDLRISTNASTAGHYDFEWDSQSGKVYDLVSAPDLSTAPDNWAVWDGRSELTANPPTNTLSGIPGGGDPKRFFAVVEKEGPPLLSEDFESATAPGLPTGWTAADNGAGTSWSVGTPDGSDFEPDSAANGNQSAGTNLNATYTGSAVASLITPAFTVPTGGARLNFSQYIDTELASGGGDFGSIRLLDAADDTPLAGGEVAPDIQGITEGWSNESLPLPEVANGLEVKLEFRFESDEDTELFAGFYIDDVEVTAN